MTHLASKAAEDYNENIRATKHAADRLGIDTIVSTVLCGWADYRRERGTVKREVVNSNAKVLEPIDPRDYKTNGGSTPLYDSVLEVIKLLEQVPDKDDKEVSFLVIVITDGQENASDATHHHMHRKLRALQGTDRWTFTFRVPKGYKQDCVYMGIPEGNIIEWDQTQEGLERSTKDNVQAIDNYYVGRSKGIRGTSTFYADLRAVSTKDIKRSMKDISRHVRIWAVSKYSNTSEIRTYVERQLGTEGSYLKGAAFYQLTKSEKVQPYKQLVIVDRNTGKVYGGYDARYLLGLPDQGEIRLKPGDHGHFDVFVQSTSVNRKLVGGTKLVYWTGAVL
jgi:hypothetical protein